MRTVCRRCALLILMLVVLVLAGCTAFSELPLRQATPTPVLVDANAPVLGGSEAAFIKKFGQPIALRYIYRFTAPNGERVVLTLGLLHVLANGRIRVSTIVLQPEHETEQGGAAVQATFQSFFPPDSTPIADITANAETHHLYMSDLLAATFPPEAFIDASGRQHEQGTFDVFCHTTHLRDIGPYGCGIMVGEWPST